MDAPPAQRPPPCRVVAIAGGTGSGKTTLATALAAGLGPDRTVVIAQDRYYRDLSEHGGVPPERVDFDDPSAVDLDLLAEHVRSLRAGRAVRLPEYDFARHRRRPPGGATEPRAVVIVEGLFALWHAPLRELASLRVFVDAPADVRLARRLRRDVVERGRSAASVLDQYEASVRPGHLRFVEPSRRFADVVVSGDPEPGAGGLGAVVEGLRQRLGATSPAAAEVGA